MHDLDHRHVAEIEDRVAAPLTARDHAGRQHARQLRTASSSTLLRRELHLLLERAARGLDHVAVHLVLDARRVDQQPRVVPHHHAAHMHLAGLLVDLDIGHPRGPRRAEARPLAVDVARVRKALAEEDVAAFAEPAIGVLLRPGAHAPAGLLRGGLHELDRARIVQVPQAELHGVDTRRRGQLVDVRLVRERTRQRRHAAQPRGAHDRRHVVDLHAQVVVAVRRARGAVAHLVGLRHGLDRAREQQCQRGRAVRRVRSLEVVGGDAAVGHEPAVDLHELRGALGLPRMLLLARELHAHRRTHGTREQRGIGRHVVGAVAAVAARGLHAHDVDLHVVHAHELREIGAQDVRVLRAGPAAQLQAAAIRRLPLGQRARRADGRMHLVGPHVGALHRLRGGGHGAVDVAFVDQQALRRGVVAQGLCHVAQVGHAGPGLPGHAQFAHRLLGVFLALGDDADEVAHHDHGADAGDVCDRRFVDRFERVADELAVVRARIRRAHHAAVQHAGHAHVVHEHEVARELGRDVDARLARADEAVVGRVLWFCVEVEPQHGALVRHEVRVVEVAVRRLGHAHHAVAHLQRIDGHAQPLGRAREQPRTRLRGGQPQRLRVDLDRRARDGRALVGRARGVAEHHAHAGHAEVELFGHDLRQRRADAGAQVDVAVERGDAAVVPQREQHLVAFAGVAGDEGGLALRGRRRGRRFAHHQQHAVGGEEFRARLRQVGAARHAAEASGGAARRRTAARCTASRISMCVPQRHRLPESSLRMRASLASGSRASSAAACITMPLRQ
ncbi:hypothetical protein FQZ97_666200 [compost metagenome]